MVSFGDALDAITNVAKDIGQPGGILRASSDKSKSGPTPQDVVQTAKDIGQPGGILRASLAGGEQRTDTPAAASSTPAATSSIPGNIPTGGTVQGPAGRFTGTMNPLAVNAFYAQYIAPMMQALGAPAGPDSVQAQLAGMATPYAANIPKNFQGVLANEAAQNQQLSDTVNKNAAEAALNAPAITDLENQMGAIRTQQLKNYAKLILSGGDPTAGLTQ